MAIKVYQDDAANLKFVDTVQSTARTLDYIVRGTGSIAETQTLTNKTLTSPVLTTPVVNTSISGTAIATGAEVTTGTDNTKIVTPKAIGDAGVNTRLKVKVGSFTYNIATASGTQAITGVGFQPTAVVFISAVHGAKQASWGLDDGTTHICVEDIGGATADTYGSSTSNSSIYMFVDGSNMAIGYISAFGADGFTITWTKTGSPTGTATIGYLAFR